MYVSGPLAAAQFHISQKAGPATKGGCWEGVVKGAQELNNGQNTPKEATIKEEKQRLTAKHLLRLSFDVAGKCTKTAKIK